MSILLAVGTNEAITALFVIGGIVFCLICLIWALIERQRAIDYSDKLYEAYQQHSQQQAMQIAMFLKLKRTIGSYNKLSKKSRKLFNFEDGWEDWLTRDDAVDGWLNEFDSMPGLMQNLTDSSKKVLSLLMKEEYDREYTKRK